MKRYTVAEAAAYLGVDPKTFLNWRKKHRIAAEKGEVDGREHLITSDELKHLAKLHGEKKRKEAPQTSRTHHGKTRQELEAEIATLRAKLAEAEAPVKRLNEGNFSNAPVTRQDGLQAASYFQPTSEPQVPFVPILADHVQPARPLHDGVVSHIPVTRPPRSRDGDTRSNPLPPEGWITVNQAAEQLEVPESTWRRNAKKGAKRGGFDCHRASEESPTHRWESPGRPAEYALDPEQYQAFIEWNEVRPKVHA